jgi:hypothetical protein
LNCVEVKAQFSQQVPSIMLLIDQSGSMTTDFSGKSRWNALRDALMDPTSGLVKVLQDEVRFGLTLYTNDRKGACPDLTQVAIALHNYTPINGVYSGAAPTGDTPTSESVDTVAAQLGAYPEPGPKVILLATDGLPDTCAVPSPDPADDRPRQLVVNAVTSAFSSGIFTFVISVGNEITPDHLRQVANVGQGFPVDSPVDRFFTANDQQQLIDAFTTIIRGVRSCVLALNGTVVAGTEGQGTVNLDGQPLTYGSADGWRLNNPSELELLGSACATLQSGNHALDITFPCQTFIIQ